MTKPFALISSCLGAILMLSSANLLLAETRGESKPAYRHAYYLFLADAPRDCEACYVPLLISEAPLEEIAKNKSGANCALLVTYERDSIWSLEGTPLISPADIEALPRKIRVKGQEYRYQEIATTEVLKLLKNPMGSIPISRIASFNVQSLGPILEDLISDFNGLK